VPRRAIGTPASFFEGVHAWSRSLCSRLFLPVGKTSVWVDGASSIRVFGALSSNLGGGSLISSSH
jgi:hypothetical protein